MVKLAVMCFFFFWVCFFFLQISEVVNSMKDLIDFSRENSIGPIGMPQCHCKKMDFFLVV
jgi:hypothetical protein